MGDVLSDGVQRWIQTLPPNFEKAVRALLGDGDMGQLVADTLSNISKNLKSDGHDRDGSNYFSGTLSALTSELKAVTKAKEQVIYNPGVPTQRTIAAYT